MTEKRAQTPQAAKASPASKRKFSLDTWAVIVALALSGAVWIGLIKHVPW
ncbi:MAG: hypothetical protein WCA00_17870 [Candidatus Acidiferrales bacterium]